MDQKNTYEVGKKGEQYVCNRLEERGFEIVDKNVQTRFSEIDIVAKDNGVLCFVEVRTRADESLGHPAETINFSKQRTLRRAAEAYMLKNATELCPVRFDVATIIWSSMQFEYFENAF